MNCFRWYKGTTAVYSIHTMKISLYLQCLTLMLQLYALSVIFFYRTSQASTLLDLLLKSDGPVFFDGRTKVEKSKVKTAILAPPKKEQYHP